MSSIQFARRVTPLLAALLWLLAGAALAQGWPTQPVKIVAPVPAGGGVDLLSRAIAQKLQEQWNVNVVVENKPGASAAIGTDHVARSTDNHTLLMGYSVIATNKFLVSKLPYDLDRDLTPVIHVGYIPLILVTQPTFPANSVKELIALLKANPGKYQYASGGAGAGAHLSGEMFKHLTGVELTHVPYKGNAPALNDVLGGHVAIMFDTITTSIPHVKSGKLKGLATTGDKRSPLAPELPTMIEAGVPGFEISAWYMMLAPKSMPKEAVQKVNAAVNKAIADPDVAQRLSAQGVAFVGGSVKSAEDFLAAEIDKWGRIIKAANIKAE
jgi:tripartite-type tricarboxylate transporter receptor subunit TctC